MDTKLDEILLACNNRVTPLDTDRQAIAEAKQGIKDLFKEMIERAKPEKKETVIGGGFEYDDNGKTIPGTLRIDMTPVRNNGPYNKAVDDYHANLLRELGIETGGDNT